MLGKSDEQKLGHFRNRKSIKDDLEKIRCMKEARAVRVQDDEKVGLLFKLCGNIVIIYR